MLLLYLMAVALFAASALILGLARKRLEKSRNYRCEAAALSACQSGLARAILGLQEDPEGYEGESLSWPGGQSAEVRLSREGDEDYDLEVSVRGMARGSGQNPSVRSLWARFLLREGRLRLVSQGVIPRAELAALL